MVAPPDHRSLVPGAVRALVRDLGRGPSVARLGGYRAWQYAGLPGRNGTDVVDVTVLPTSAGVLSVACTSPQWLVDAGCASSIGAVSVSGAAVFVPSSDLALRLRLPHVLAALDGRRIRTRAALDRAAGRGGQSRLARRLAGAHTVAAESLRPVAGRTGSPLIDELAHVASGYSALARAASGGSPAPFRTARGTVQAAEERLDEEIDRLVSRDEREAVAAEATHPSPQPSVTDSRDTPLLLLLIGMLVGAFAIGLAALWRRGVPAWTPPRDRGRRAVRSSFEDRGPVPRDERSRVPSDAHPGRPPAGPFTRWDAPPSPPPESPSRPG
jgi:hypothetical protein